VFMGPGMRRDDSWKNSTYFFTTLCGKYLVVPAKAGTYTPRPRLGQRIEFHFPLFP
jgi:hypothetical protein